MIVNVLDEWYDIGHFFVLTNDTVDLGTGEHRPHESSHTRQTSVSDRGLMENQATACVHCPEGTLGVNDEGRGITSVVHSLSSQCLLPLPL